MNAKHLFCTLSAAVVAGIALAQGPLAPSGAPAPVMKSLDQIEPRTPVSSLPFTISQSGSYYLSRNLQFTAATGNAITIEPSNVTLDLMGFTLSSTSAVTGDAVRVNAGTSNITIKNGVIAGNTTVTVTPGGSTPWVVAAAGFNNGINGSAASNPSADCRFSDLLISGCRNVGLAGGTQAILKGITASRNGFGGISTDGYGSLTGCNVNSNGGIGVNNNLGTIVNCAAFRNRNHGMINTNGVVINTVAAENGGPGISASGGSIDNCTAKFNGDTGIVGDVITNSNAIQNDGIGIAGTNISNCNAINNGGHGIRATAGVLSFCKAALNNANDNGSVDISTPGTTIRTGNNPAP